MAELSDLAATMLHDAGRRHAEAMLASEPDYCVRCLGDGPLRTWPLAELTVVGSAVCDRCWLKLARGRVEARNDGRQLSVWSHHPQHGELFRGTIRAAGIVPGGLQPPIRWRISDHDAHDLGELVGDYADAEARLLDATAWADEIDEEPT